MEPSLHEKLSSLCLISQKKLEKILSQCGEKKDMIIDSTLIKPFERVCGISWLRQRGVEKVYKMVPKVNTSNQNRIYLIPASLSTYRNALDQIASVLSQNETLSTQKCFHIIIIPKVLSRFELMLENRGLYGIVKLYSFAWELMLLDEGILSLEIPYFYKMAFVDQDQSLLSSVAMSLWSLFHVIGRPKVSLAVGKMAASVLDILKIYEDTFSRENIKKCTQEIGALIVIDRNQDYASSLLTPATYSGLLNEIFTVKSGYLELNVKNNKLTMGTFNLEFDKKEEEEKIPIVPLDSSLDSLWKEIKYRHFSEVLAVLSVKAKALKQSNVKGLGIEDLKKFVSSKLQQVALEKKNLVNHVLACETIMSEMKHCFESLKSTEIDMINNVNRKRNFNFIDEHFGTDIHIHNSLRLMCLLSLTQHVTLEEYQTLVKKYLHAFGHKYLYVFNKLVDSGLFVQPSASRLPLNMSSKLGNISDHLPKLQNSFNTAASKLKQLPNSEDHTSKTSPSYVFNGGYIPLVSVLCNAVLKSENLSEAINKLSSLNDLKVGGKILDELNTRFETLDEKLSTLNIENDLDHGSKPAKVFLNELKASNNVRELLPLKPRCVLVYVIGGVNYAEIAACDITRMVTGSNIIVASDCITSGSDLISDHF